MNDYYDRQGKPISQTEWGVLHRRMEYKVVQKTDVDGAEVSTVWLGIDHGFGDDAPPIIFETMVFGGPFDDYMTRYCTEEEAREGHERIVAGLREGVFADA